MSDYIFEMIDKTGRKIHLSKERWSHIKRHPHMDVSLERIKDTLLKPVSIRFNIEDETIRYFYKEYKEMDVYERYLFVLS